jgi:hypothetical protein
MSEPEKSESNESEEPKPQPTRERKPRKRVTKPKGAARVAGTRTSARDGRRQSKVNTDRGQKRRGRPKQIVPKPHDPGFWLDMLITLSFVGFGIVNTIKGNDAAVLASFAAASANFRSSYVLRNK